MRGLLVLAVVLGGCVAEIEGGPYCDGDGVLDATCGDADYFVACGENDPDNFALTTGDLCVDGEVTCRDGSAPYCLRWDAVEP